MVIWVTSKHIRTVKKETPIKYKDSLHEDTEVVSGIGCLMPPNNTKPLLIGLAWWSGFPSLIVYDEYAKVNLIWKTISQDEIHAHKKFCTNNQPKQTRYYICSNLIFPRERVSHALSLWRPQPVVGRPTATVFHMKWMSSAASSKALLRGPRSGKESRPNVFVGTAATVEIWDAASQFSAC